MTATRLIDHAVDSSRIEPERLLSTNDTKLHEQISGDLPTNHYSKGMIDMCQIVLFVCFVPFVDSDFD